MDIKVTFNVVPIVAVLLVLAAYYIPKFKEWYAALKSETKQLVMIVLMALTVLVGILLSVFGFMDIYAGSTWQEWVWYPLIDFIFGILVNAGVYKETNYLLGKKAQG